MKKAGLVVLFVTLAAVPRARADEQP